MNALLSLKKALILCTVILLSLTFSSWKDSGNRLAKAVQDTVPPTHGKTTVDLDAALDNLDNAKVDLDKSVHDIDWDKMNADLKNAMKNLDVELQHMNVDLKKTLQEIDVEKLKRDVDASVATIDWDKIRQSIDETKEIDRDKMKAEVEKAKAEIEKQKPEIEKSLRAARSQMEKAKVKLMGYKTFVADLERDGLISKKQGYKIEHRGGHLLINDKEQPAAVYNKYRAFLQKNGAFTLKNDGADIMLNDE